MIILFDGNNKHILSLSWVWVKTISKQADQFGSALVSSKQTILSNSIQWMLPVGIRGILLQLGVVLWWCEHRTAIYIPIVITHSVPK